MDGVRMAPAEALIRDRTLRDRGGIGGAATRPAKTIRWFVIVGLLLAIVLGGLYGFNRFRQQAIATFFANNKPPPARISAVEVKTEAVPRFATGIGAVAAVHQVTINPEVGGRVTRIFFEPGTMVKAGDPLVQLNDGPERGDLASYQAQARWAETTLQRSSQLAQHQYEARETVDQKQSELDRGRAMPHARRPDRHSDRSVNALCELHLAIANASAGRGGAACQRHCRRLSGPNVY